jgi:ceramide glucosyltransferase
MTGALVFLSGLAASVAVYGLAVVALHAHRRDSRGRAVPGLTPPISIVKPLAGLDDRLEENLETFFLLDYPDYEVIFSFASEEDAAFSVARRVADRHPTVVSVFVFDGREPGANAKVNRLAAGVRRARGRVLLFSDGNVRVEPGFLRAAVSFFADPSVGLVSHLFRASGARTIASRVESLHLNGFLQAGTAVVARWLGMPCVVGKSILMSRAALNAIGGFSSLRDYLAEDYLLGTTVTKAGYRVILCADEVETAEVSKSPGAIWARQRRWAILRKRLGGPAYLAEALSSPTLWWLGAISASEGRIGVIGAAAALLVLRVALEGFSAALANRPLTLSDYCAIPLRDAGVAAVFFAGLFGVRTVWRGRALRVGRGSLLVPDPRNPFFSIAQGLILPNKIRQN